MTNQTTNVRASARDRFAVILIVSALGIFAAFAASGPPTPTANAAYEYEYSTTITTSTSTSTSSSTPTSTSTTSSTTRSTTSSTTTTTTTPPTSSTTTTTTTTTTPTTAAQRVIVCHRTGSTKNPYVRIRVSRSALPAHLRHGDIYPAPARCPSTVQRTNGKGKVLGARKAKKNRGVGHFTGYRPG